MSTLKDIQDAVRDLYPTLSGSQVRRAASQIFDAKIPATPWNITETIQSGRAPQDGFMRCKKQRRATPMSAMRIADMTGNEAARNADAAARRLGLNGAGA